MSLSYSSSLVVPSSSSSSSASTNTECGDANFSKTAALGEVVVSKHRVEVPVVLDDTITESDAEDTFFRCNRYWTARSFACVLLCILPLAVLTIDAVYNNITAHGLLLTFSTFTLCAAFVALRMQRDQRTSKAEDAKSDYDCATSIDMFFMAIAFGLDWVCVYGIPSNLTTKLVVLGQQIIGMSVWLYARYRIFGESERRRPLQFRGAWALALVHHIVIAVAQNLQEPLNIVYAEHSNDQSMNYVYHLGLEAVSISCLMCGIVFAITTIVYRRVHNVDYSDWCPMKQIVWLDLLSVGFILCVAADIASMLPYLATA